MQKRIYTYKWLLAVFILLWGCIASSVYAYDQVAQTSSWRTMPTYSMQPTYTPATVSSVTNYSATAPTYNFKSTSTYPSLVGNSVFTSKVSTPYSNFQRTPIRKSGSWGGDDDEDPEGEEIGIQPTTPVGEPWVLLVLALLYVVFGKKGIRIFLRNHEDGLL